MTISEQGESFAGFPIVSWEPDDPETPETDYSRRAIRISVSYDEADDGVTWTDKFAEFLEQPHVDRLVAFVVGGWEEAATGESSARIVEALVEAKESLPNLRAIFFGDITYEESEISWIEQSDVSSLFIAYPLLEHFCIRGGNNLNLGTMRLDKLKSLTIQTGGLSREIVAQVCRAELPLLEHLELWLGSQSYGGDCQIEDIMPLLELNKFPSMKFLGLQDSELSDAIAEAVANAPVLKQLEVLDLSMGVLSDDGAEHLINSSAIKKLKKLNLRHHYMSDAMLHRWSASGINVDVSDQQKADDPDDRYVEVSE